MNKQTKSNQTLELQYFFSGQNFTDGLRVTFGILVPALVAAQFNLLELGVLLSFGALCVSITDMPGPPVHKRNGMLFCCLTIFVVALITGFARMHPVLLGAEILVFSFFFSMFAVYGNRAAALGTAALLIMVLLMDEPMAPLQVLQYSALVCAGGLWYMLLSLLVYRIRPYLPVQQALGECIHEVAKFLSLKADFYRSGTDLDEAYRKLVLQQVLVNEKQEAVRELLFKSRLLVKESTNASRRLLLTFVDLVDLYEQVMVIHYDYASMRERFGKTGILDTVADQILQLAGELSRIGFAIQTSSRYKRQFTFTPQLEALKDRIDALSEASSEFGALQPAESVLVLKKVLINLRNITQRISDIVSYYDNSQDVPAIKNSEQLEFSRFITHQPFSKKLFFDNLTTGSAIFKHSLRVALVCLFGFVLTKLLPYGEHTYWVLLTIIVILKPAFSLSKQRNYERLLGTVIGGILGFCILLLILDPLVLFILLAVLMVGTFSLIRTNYILSVIFMTPFVLIIFSFLGADNLVLVQERILDTLIGSAIAFSATYLLFPSWESEQLHRHMQLVIEANIQYLQKLAERLMGKEVRLADYKLARKEVYVKSANLAAAFQRMLSEPERKQRNSREVHRFVVLNHILSANIATLATATVAHQEMQFRPDSLRPVRRALAMLYEARKKLAPDLVLSYTALPELPPQAAAVTARLNAPEETLLQEQLEFIQKICTDIRKHTESIV